MKRKSEDSMISIQVNSHLFPPGFAPAFFFSPPTAALWRCMKHRCQSLDEGIAQSTPQQSTKLMQQVDVVQGRMNELVAESTQTGNINPAQQITTQAETLVSALQALPPTIKAKIGYDTVFNALLSAQMNGSNVELAQAALDKASAGVEGLRKNSLKSAALPHLSRAFFSSEYYSCR